MSRLVIPAILAATCLSWNGAHSQVTTKSFQLISEAKFLDCFATAVPTATVTVSRAGKRDKLVLDVSGLKPDLRFDVFTVQRSNLLANGTVDPNFTNFGLAWYQSDLTADQSGNATITLSSVFADQIFGFDADVTLPPINTFHIGFWLDNPAKAKRCGFMGTTPFNGEHQAGPAAMISVPDATTGLGPLCLNSSPSSPSGCAN
jgi:hypothetical protein